MQPTDLQFESQLLGAQSGTNYRTVFSSDVR